MIYSEDQVYGVLRAIGLDVESSAGDDWLIYCPYHDNSRTPAGEISKTRGTFYCFSCGAAASLNKLVMKVSGKTYFEALRLIASKGRSTDIQSDIVNALVEPEPEFVAFDSATVERLHDNIYQNSRGNQYFQSRGITDSSIRKFFLGYSSVHDMVTVPVHSPDGIIIGFVARSIQGKSFKNSSGLPKSKTLFNLHRVKTKPYVFVVESSFDAIRLDQAGLPAVATLGAGVSKKQAQLLDKYFNTIYSVPDNDLAGREMTDKLRNRLGEKLISIALPAGAKDVGDLTDAQIEKLRVGIDNPLLGVL